MSNSSSGKIALFGALIKTYSARKEGMDPADICSVSVMPCTAKKSGAAAGAQTAAGRDTAITVEELAKMIRTAGVDLRILRIAPFDLPCRPGQRRARRFFGTTAAWMEAALRTVYEVVTGEEPPL